MDLHFHVLLGSMHCLAFYLKFCNISLFIYKICKHIDSKERGYKITGSLRSRIRRHQLIVTEYSVNFERLDRWQLAEVMWFERLLWGRDSHSFLCLKLTLVHQFAQDNHTDPLIFSQIIPKNVTVLRLIKKNQNIQTWQLKRIFWKSPFETEWTFLFFWSANQRNPIIATCSERV